jgi:hypothetical protein
MVNYRKIWEDANGSIPKDEIGRSYDIHHIDGNRRNNHISNLVAVSRREHYEIHKKQGDWHACLLLQKDLYITEEEFKEIKALSSQLRKGIKLSKEHRLKLSEAKKGKPSNSKGKKRSIETRKRITESRTGEKNWRLGTKHSENTIKKMKKPKSESGRLNIKNGAQNRPVIACPYCKISGQYNAMQRWHFDNCKNKE